MPDAQTIGKIIYEEVAKQQQDAGAVGSVSEENVDTSHGGKDDVIDAEFEVKDAK